MAQLGPVAIALFGAAMLPWAGYCQFNGTFSDASGTAHSWQISSAHTLIWDAKPWIPLGPRVGPGDVVKLAAVKRSGLQDVLLIFAPDQPLQPLIDAAEQAGLRYCLTPGAPAPTTQGDYIMPQSYRVADLHGEMDLRLRVPGADSAFYVLAEYDTTAIEETGRATVEGGFAAIAIRPKHEGNYVLILYAHAKEGNIPDYWEGYDAWRDNLLVKLHGVKLGPGMRGFIDPLGEVQNWYDFSHRFVPDSALFRLEFERYLRRKYPNPAKLSLAWRTKNKDFATYGEAAAQVPLFAEGRGVAYLWNPHGDVLLEVEKGGSYWQDYEAYLKAAAIQRAGNLSAAIRKLVDVPVIYTWRGWSPVTQAETAAGQGLGMRGYGKGNAPATHWAAYTLGAAQTWRQPPWLIATDIAADEHGAVYGTDDDPLPAIDTLASLGAKGFFVRTALADAALAAMAKGAGRLPASEQMPTTLEFPEIARTPADVLLLPRGVWWIPSPRAGARLDFGSQFNGYRLTTAHGTMVAMWSAGDERQAQMHFGDAKAIRVTTYDGSPVETKLRSDSLTLDVGELPVLFFSDTELPVPDSVFKETDQAIRAYLKTDAKPGSDMSDLKRRYETALDGFARNPGNAFAIMREIYETIMGRVGDYVWLEGEKPTRTTFGFVASSAAASAEKYLALDTPFEPLAGTYTAGYAVNNGSTPSTLHVFVAGSVPPAGTLHFEWRIDESAWSPFNTEALSFYGDRFGWYDGGVANIPAGRHILTIGVRGGPGAYYDASIDAVLLTAGAFVPSGVRRPTVAVRK